MGVPWICPSEIWECHEIEDDDRVLINLSKGSKDHDQTTKNPESKKAQHDGHGSIHPNAAVRAEDGDGDDDDFCAWDGKVTVNIQEIFGHDSNGSVQTDQVTSC